MSTEVTDLELEALSEKIRKGEPVSMMDAILAIEYQERKKRNKPSLMQRIKEWVLDKLTLVW